MSIAGRLIEHSFKRMGERELKRMCLAHRYGAYLFAISIIVRFPHCFSGMKNVYVTMLQILSAFHLFTQAGHYEYLNKLNHEGTSKETDK